MSMPEEKIEQLATPTDEEVAAVTPLGVVTEVIEEGADLVIEIAKVVENASDEVVEVAAVATEVAEEIKVAAEKVSAVAEEIKQLAAEDTDEAPAGDLVATEEIRASPADLLETLAPIQTTFVELPAAPCTASLGSVKAIAPLKYSDLGKEARDLITNDFYTTKHLKVNTTSANGFQFTTESHNSDSGLVGAFLETKYLCEKSDWSISAKFNTDNVLSSSLSVANPFFDGLNVDIDTSYSLVSGKRSVNVRTAYTGSSVFHPTLDLDIADITKPNIDCSLMLAHKGFLAGYQTSFDSSASKVLGHNACLGYKTNNLILTGAVENASKFLGSVYYKIKEGLTAAAHLEYTSGGSPNVTLCGKYDMGSDTSIKVKVDQNLTIGGSYTQNIRSGISLTSSCILNGKSVDRGGHKVGLSLSFEA